MQFEKNTPSFTIERINLTDKERSYIYFSDAGVAVIHKAGNERMLNIRLSVLLRILAENNGKPLTRPNLVEMFLCYGINIDRDNRISTYVGNLVKCINETCGYNLKDTKNLSGIYLYSIPGPNGGISIHIPEERIIKKEYETTSTRQYTLKKTLTDSTGPVSKENYIEREKIKEIEESFRREKSHKAICVLSGMAGLGKSELARSYAQKSIKLNQRYDTVVEVEYCEARNRKTAFDCSIDKLDIKIINEYIKDSNEQLNAKKAALKSSNKTSLLVIHNFDKRDMQFARALEQNTGNADILITTRRKSLSSEIPSISGFVSLDDDSEQIRFGCRVFMRYANLDEFISRAPLLPQGIRKEIEDLTLKIAGAVNGHTMMCAILGAMLKNRTDYLVHVKRVRKSQSGTTIAKHVLMQLQDISAVCNSLQVMDHESSVLINKDGVGKKDNPYKLIKELFQKQLITVDSEMERQVFGALVMLETAKVNISEKTLSEILGDTFDQHEARDAIKSLRDQELLMNRKGGALTLHPLINQLVQDTSIRNKNGKPIAELSGQFLYHIINNCFTIDRFGFEECKTTIGKYVDNLTSNKAKAKTLTSIRGWGLLYLYDSRKEYYNAVLESVSKMIYENHEGYYSREEIVKDLSQIALSWGKYEDPITGYVRYAVAVNKDPVTVYVAYGNEGRAAFVRISGNDYCFINCSTQRKNNDRYFEPNRATTLQIGQMFEAVLRGKLIPPLTETIDENAIVPLIQYKTISKNHSIPVVEIGPFAFHGMRFMHYLRIPEGIRKLQDNAFSDCDNLNQVEFPSTLLEIGESAFSGCRNLSSVSLSQNIYRIGHSAFWGCIGDFRIFIDENNPYFLSCADGAGVVSKTDKTLVWAGALSMIPREVQSIGEAAFEGNQRIEVLNVPSSIQRIESWAFMDCYRLKKVNMEYGIRVIGQSAFCHSGIESVVLPESLQLLGIGIFRDCKNLNSVVLPNSIETIPELSFAGCESLKEIYIPPSVKTIGPRAFIDCSNLQRVTYSRKTRIDDTAFEECPEITFSYVSE